MSKKFRKESEKTIKSQQQKFEARANYVPKDDEVCFKHCLIIKVNPGTKFIAKTEQNTEIRCQLSGRMFQNKINVMEDDLVTVVTSVYDLTNGRIVEREKQPKK